MTTVSGSRAARVGDVDDGNRRHQLVERELRGRAAADDEVRGHVEVRSRVLPEVPDLPVEAVDGHGHMRLARGPGDTWEHRYPDTEEMRQILRLLAAALPRRPRAARQRSRERGARAEEQRRSAGRAAAPSPPPPPARPGCERPRWSLGRTSNPPLSSGLPLPKLYLKASVFKQARTDPSTAATPLAASGVFARHKICFRRSCDLRQQWSQPGSNRRPSGCQPDALPAELWPLGLGDCS